MAPHLSAPREVACIGLGGNIGSRDIVRARLGAAVQALHRLPQTRVIAVSSLYRSAPVDASGPEFLNAVVALDTALAPQDLLHALQAVEQEHGRQRPYRNAPRTLDLDLLLHGAQVVDTPELTVPHPRITQRAFVLRPLAEVLARVLDPEPAGWLDDSPGAALQGWLATAQAALAAVADQDIERLDGAADGDWAGPLPAGSAQPAEAATLPNITINLPKE